MVIITEEEKKSLLKEKNDRIKKFYRREKIKYKIIKIRKLT